MNQEIKALYKKDPKLAKEVAKVLGYKIVAQPVPKKLKKILKDIVKKGEDLKTTMDTAKQIIKPLTIKLDAPQVVKDLGKSIVEDRKKINDIIWQYKTSKIKEL